MEEKIVEAQFTKNKLAKHFLSAGIVLIILSIIVAFFTYLIGYDSYYNDYTDVYDSFFEFFFDILSGYIEFYFFYDVALFAHILSIGLLGIILAFFFKWKMSKCALTVTNRRVTGKASFGKSVDLPLNQISAVALGSFSRITVATSSGKIHFWFIKNRSEVHSSLNNVIGKVQVESAYNQTNNSASEADELKKYKDLLDSGIITQEEFDAKKKQLLGL